jgi:hypothetical protein
MGAPLLERDDLRERLVDGLFHGRGTEDLAGASQAFFIECRSLLGYDYPRPFR